MNQYLIPKEHLERLLEACSTQNKCSKGSPECLCQKELREPLGEYPDNLKELFK